MTKGKSSPSSGKAPPLKSHGPKRTLQKKVVVVSKEVLRSQLERVNALASNWLTRLGRHKASKKQRVIHTASDCSGHGLDLIAYRLLGLQSQVQPVMMSEVSRQKVLLHQAVAQECGWNYDDHQVIDMFLRKEESMKTADVYVAGYPCPSYSKLGKRQGVSDQRGLLTLKGLEYVALCRPKVVVLEQVKAILEKKHSQIWNYILKILNKLDYVFDHQVLSTQDFAIPQSRPRVYILAVAKEICAGTVKLPEKRSEKVDLHHFIQKDKTGSEVLQLPRYEELLGSKMWRKGYILDVGSSEKFQAAMTNCAPCLTHTRLGQGGYYIPKLRRRLLLEEAGALQGVPKKVVRAMQRAAEEHKLPARTVDASLGDAMSINVLASVLMKGLTHSRLVQFSAQEDHWRLVANGPDAATLSDRLFDGTAWAGPGLK